MLLGLSIEEQAYKTQYGILKQYQVQELTMDIYSFAPKLAPYYYAFDLMLYYDTIFPLVYCWLLMFNFNWNTILIAVYEWT